MDVETVGGLASQETEASFSKELDHNEDAMPKDYNSDMSYNDEDNDDDADYAESDDYIFDNDDEYLNMQAQFDNVDLPPGVEAPVNWLKDIVPSASVAVAGTTSSQVDPVVLAVGAGMPNPSDKSVAESSSTIHAEVGLNRKNESENLDEIMQKFKLFKRFDTVDDILDHHYSRMGNSQPTKDWTKKIQDEWRILEKGLPDTIYVRVCETRMDILRAVIVGPAGTPYHDGLFVFDVFFPTNYPSIPPMVYYYSGGLRLNPNLYDCGKVCLSLLNTWTGDANEKWMPQTSTMLQVLVSIQALILNANPFFNEPGYENTYVGPEGEKRSKDYNENAFILSLKTMIYTLRRPPKHFEDLVIGHFHSRAHDILSACKAYLDGALVGFPANDTGRVQSSGSAEFKTSVARMMNGLVSNFGRYAAKDCEMFRPSA